jgi:serine/threonine protein kinase
MPVVRLHAGMTVGRYELLRCIGHGAMGVVYEAVHESLRRRVALKVLHRPAADPAQAEREAERFLREGRAAAQVRHTHVVDVYDFGVEDGLAFLVMELVQGESLAQLLRRETTLPLERCVEILLPVLSAVAELHAAGIVHRDIKPANILLPRGVHPCPKLADFGVSRFDDESPGITQSGALVGTPEYMAPELMLATARAGEKTDQYALGVTAYECATGQRPFRGATEYELMHAIVSAKLVAPSVRERSLPEAFDRVVLRAMHRDPARRFASIDELAESLLAFAPREVSARWQHEFLPLGDPSRWTASQSVPPVPVSASEPRKTRSRLSHGLTRGAGVILGLLMLWAVASRGSPHRAPVGARQPELVPIRTPDEAPKAPQSAASNSTPAASVIATPSDPPSLALPATSAPRRERSAAARPRATASPAASAASTTPTEIPSTIVHGENAAPILDVP